MTRLCKHGHEQTPENQYKVNDKQRGVRYRCKPCALENRHRTGGLNIVAQRVQAHRNRVEDIEFLLSQGVNGQELLERSGYTRMRYLKNALTKAGRNDLREQVR